MKKSGARKTLLPFFSFHIVSFSLVPKFPRKTHSDTLQKIEIEKRKNSSANTMAREQTQNAHFNPFLSWSSPLSSLRSPSIVWITHVFDWNLVADTIPLFLKMCLFSISLYSIFYCSRFLYFSNFWILFSLGFP